MAIRDARSRHARTTPQGYPPPEAYGPVWPFVPQQAGSPEAYGTPTSGTPTSGTWTPHLPQGRYAVPPQVGAPHGTLPGHPHHHAAGAHAATPTNSLAVGGFVVAVVGLVLSVLPVVGLLGWLLCPVGLGLSAAGLVRVPRRGGAGRGLAVAGVVLGALGVVVCLLWVVALTR